MNKGSDAPKLLAQKCPPSAVQRQRTRLTFSTANETLKQSAIPSTDTPPPGAEKQKRGVGGGVTEKKEEGERRKSEKRKG